MLLVHQTVAHKDLRSRLSEQIAQKQAALSSDARLEPPASSRIGTVLSRRYRIDELLGVGGMGTVYLARDLELEDNVALKLLRRDVIDAPGAIDRFRREVKLARRVTHPNVSRTYDIASDDEDHFITMEPISGNTLAGVIMGPRLDDRVIAQIGVQICAGLNAAHRAGVVHRDLKPQNVMLEPHGSEPKRVVIMDFGIAQSSRVAGEGESVVGQVVGTPAYMAPEQLSGLAVDHRADLCSLGIVLFELFTGVLPWHGESPSATALARLRQDAPDPRIFRKDIPEALARLTQACLARSPGARPSSAASVGQRLEAWLGTGSAHPNKPLLWLPTGDGSEGVTLTSHGLSQVNAALARHSADLAITPARPASTPRSDGSMRPSSYRLPPSGRSERPSVAVVPSVRADAVTERDCHLLAELCEEVADQLSTAPGVRVRSLGTVLSVQRENPSWDAERLGRALEVDFVVEVSAAPVSAECILRTRILDVGQDVQLWADRVRTGHAEAIEACERAARAAAAALTQQTLEDPAFHTWQDPVPSSDAPAAWAEPADEESAEHSNSLPRGNREEPSPSDGHGAPVEGGAPKPGSRRASA